jgi:hypothetical protein
VLLRFGSRLGHVGRDLIGAGLEPLGVRGERCDLGVGFGDYL